MTTASTEEQIRRIYQAWHDATQVQDLERLGALHADDAITERRPCSESGDHTGRILGGTGLSVPPGSAPADMGFYRWKPA